MVCDTLPEPKVADAKAKKLVMDVLNKGVMNRVEFYMSGVKFGCTPDSLKQVKLRIQFDDIRVYEREGVAAWWMNLFGTIDLPSDAAYYRDKDIMVIRAKGNDIYHQAIIVHECVHAMLDMFGAKGKPLTVTTASSESMAYIAQCVYARACYEELGFMDKACPFEVKKDPNLQQVFDKAWEISAKILGGTKRVDAADEAKMVGLVPVTKLYKHKPVNVDFNGIALRPASCS